MLLYLIEPAQRLLLPSANDLGVVETHGRSSTPRSASATSIGQTVELWRSLSPRWLPCLFEQLVSLHVLLFVVMKC